MRWASLLGARVPLVTMATIVKRARQHVTTRCVKMAAHVGREELMLYANVQTCIQDSIVKKVGPVLHYIYLLLYIPMVYESL